MCWAVFCGLGLMDAQQFADAALTTPPLAPPASVSGSFFNSGPVVATWWIEATWWLEVSKATRRGRLCEDLWRKADRLCPPVSKPTPSPSCRSLPAVLLFSKLRDQAGTRGPRKQPQLRPERLGVRTWASRAPAARLRPAPRHQLCGEPALGAPRTGRQGVPAGCPACDPAPAHKRGGAATRPARSPCARQASRHLLSLRVFCPALPLAGREKHLGSSPVRLCTKPRSSTPVAAPHVHSVPPAAASAPHPWKYCGSAAAARFKGKNGKIRVTVLN
ncbi:transcriptional regulatory protein AlgP-like [Cavia porcellus]|uniref:transcriptional regulatory protein AlgP-like n=1 Tax=Cavia porcellus TaxID=10141 RepID=UPI002FE36971